MTPNALQRNPRPKVVAVRQSEPQGFNRYAQGGFTVIPRRGVTHDLCDSFSVQRMAQGSPLRLLKILPDLHPAVGLALSNALRLSCAPSDVKILAQRLDDGKDDALEQKGNAALESLWESLPSDIGGFDGLLKQLVQEDILTGLCCVEAVPGKRLQGVAEVWPVDSLSIAFKRDADTGRIVPLQKQIGYKPGVPHDLGYARLDPETFFWHASDSMVDDPYGRAQYGPAVAECLADIAMMKDLRDAVHNSAWPRLAFSFNWNETYKVAKEQYNLQEPKATEWVEERFNDLKSMVADFRPDDSIFHPSDADVKGLTPGDGFQAIKPVLEFLQGRVMQSLKAFPSLMGIALGNTETYGSIQWKVYALGLESSRDSVIAPLLKVANLHFRLLGLPLKAVAKIERIQTSDAIADAKAEAQKIENGVRKVQTGIWTMNEYSREITGRDYDPKNVPLPGAFDFRPVRVMETPQA